MKLTWYYYVPGVLLCLVGAVVLPVPTFAKPINKSIQPIFAKPESSEQPSPEKLKLIQEQKRLQTQNTTLESDSASDATVEPVLPKANFNDGLTRHEILLEQRLQRLNQFQRIPEDKRLFLQEHFEAELDWMTDARSRLRAAASDEDRATIRTEIRDHIKSVQTERRIELAKTVQLPEESRVDRAEAITEHFSTMITNLETAGLDVSTSQELFSSYQAAVASLDEAHDAVLTNKTVETIEQLKLALENVRSSSLNLRNQLRSILTTVQLTN